MVLFQARRPSQQMSPGKFSAGGVNPPPAFSPAAQFSPVGHHHPSPFSPHPSHPLHRPASANSGSERSTPTSPMGRYGDNNNHHHMGHPSQQHHNLQQQQQQYHLQELGGPAEKNHRSSGSLEGSDSSSENSSVRSSGGGGGADSTPGQVAAISSTDAASPGETAAGDGASFRPPQQSQQHIRELFQTAVFESYNLGAAAPTAGPDDRREVLITQDDGPPLTML